MLFTSTLQMYVFSYWLNILEIFCWINCKPSSSYMPIIKKSLNTSSKQVKTTVLVNNSDVIYEYITVIYKYIISFEQIVYYEFILWWFYVWFMTNHKIFKMFTNIYTGSSLNLFQLLPCLAGIILCLFCFLHNKIKK